VWQELRSQLRPLGLEIVTVAMDVGGAEAARWFIERAAPDHPSLIDSAHALGELFGVVNVPNGMWIDEDGMIVRPAEPAFPGHSPLLDEMRAADFDAAAAGGDGGTPMLTSMMGSLEGASPALVEQLKLSTHIVYEAELYRDMLFDWARNGAASRYALSPEEVVARSGPVSSDVDLAAAHFELGQYLYRAGHAEAAVPHWQQAQHLQPNNWTYKRQAWRLDPLAGTGESSYDSTWTDEVKAIGVENYYPRIEP
jgi:hypothetical protein